MGRVRSTRSRFCCPRCNAALTPWSRALALADAVCLQGDQTWLVPAGWFVRRDSVLLRGSSYFAAGPPTFSWLFAPLTSWWLRTHPDPMRSIGCCGLASYGPDAPNLVCACGHEVGLGYRDCIGPHWYALHESVVREDAADDAPPPAIAERLARARELVEAPITRAAHEACGASTPWYLTSGYLDGGTSAANLARSSMGVITRCVPPRPVYFTR
jgi:hypothetical protein